MGNCFGTKKKGSEDAPLLGGGGGESGADKGRDIHVTNDDSGSEHSEDLEEPTSPTVPLSDCQQLCRELLCTVTTTDASTGAARFSHGVLLGGGLMACVAHSICGYDFENIAINHYAGGQRHAKCAVVRYCALGGPFFGF